MYQSYRNTITSTEKDDTTSCPKYKLTYFHGRGRGEVIRLIFAAAGVQFEDNRIKSEDWPALKENTPFGTLPVLEIDGKMFGQSVAVGRAAANIANLLGDNVFEQAEADAIVDSLCDLRTEVFKVMFLKGDEKEPAVSKVVDEKCKPLMDRLSNHLGSKEYFLGQKLSWADIWFYSVLEMLIVLLKKEQVLDDYTSLKNLYNKVKDTPNVAKYLQTRPDSDF